MMLEEVRKGTVDVVKILQQIPTGRVEEMRRRILLEIMPQLLYAQPGANLHFRMPLMSVSKTCSTELQSWKLPYTNRTAVLFELNMVISIRQHAVGPPCLTIRAVLPLHCSPPLISLVS